MWILYTEYWHQTHSSDNLVRHLRSSSPLWWSLKELSPASRAKELELAEVSKNLTIKTSSSTSVSKTTRKPINETFYFHDGLWKSINAGSTIQANCCRPLLLLTAGFLGQPKHFDIGSHGLVPGVLNIDLMFSMRCLSLTNNPNSSLRNPYNSHMSCGEGTREMIGCLFVKIMRQSQHCAAVSDLRKKQLWQILGAMGLHLGELSIWIDGNSPPKQKNTSREIHHMMLL